MFLIQKYLIELMFNFIQGYLLFRQFFHHILVFRLLLKMQNPENFLKIVNLKQILSLTFTYSKRLTFIFNFFILKFDDTISLNILQQFFNQLDTLNNSDKCKVTRQLCRANVTLSVVLQFIIHFCYFKFIIHKNSSYTNRDFDIVIRLVL